jgi:transposase
MRAALAEHDLLHLRELIIKQRVMDAGIAARFNVAERTARHWRRNLVLFGQPYAPTVRARGRRRLLTAEQEEVFSSAVLGKGLYLTVIDASTVP